MGDLIKCSISGCGVDRVARGYCMRHYQQYRRTGSPLSHIYRKVNKGIVCQDCGERDAVLKHLCRRCYQRMFYRKRAAVRKANGLDPGVPRKRKPNLSGPNLNAGEYA